MYADNHKGRYFEVASTTHTTTKPCFGDIAPCLVIRGGETVGSVNAGMKSFFRPLKAERV